MLSANPRVTVTGERRTAAHVARDAAAVARDRERRRLIALTGAATLAGVALVAPKMALRVVEVLAALAVGALVRPRRW